MAGWSNGTAQQPVQYPQALMSMENWTAYMEGPSRRLQDTLYEATGDWGHNQCICGKYMGEGEVEHIQSWHHWKMLWKNLSDQIPPIGIASREEMPWVQKFKTPKGTYMFNHLTGAQNWEPNGRANGHRPPQQEAPAPAAPAAPAEPTATAVPPAPAERQVSASPAPTDVALGGHPAPQQAAAPAAQAPAPASGAAAPAQTHVTLPNTAVNPAFDYLQVMEKKETWRAFMEPKAQELEKKLHLYTNDWGGNSVCMFCEAAMGRGAGDHVASQKHWKKVWVKIQENGPPPTHMASGYNNGWTQRFDTPRGQILFNHLSGEVGLPQAATAPVAPMPTPAAAPLAPSSSPTQPACAAAGARGTAPPDSGDAWQEDTVVTSYLPDPQSVDPQSVAQVKAPPGLSLPPGSSLPSAPAPAPVAAAPATAPAAAAPAATPAAPAATTASAPQYQDIRQAQASGLSTAYLDALQDRAAWRAQSEEPTQQFENELGRMNIWPRCGVCNADMAKGAATHIPSQAHFKALWKQANNNLPQPKDAHNWRAPWVQRVDTPRGVYLFNHITCAHGYEARVMAQGAIAMQPPQQQPSSAPSAARSSAPAPAPAPAPSPAPAPAAPAAAAAPAPAPANQRPRGFTVANWLWKRHMEIGAGNLQNLLTGHDNQTCSVCDNIAMAPGAYDHIRSAGHLSKLQEKLDSMPPGFPQEPSEQQLAGGPWVQVFPRRNGLPAVRFNHITGEAGLETEAPISGNRILQ